MFEEEFPWQYHEKLLFHLQEIFDVDKTALDCFLGSEFQYKGRGNTCMFPSAKK